MTLPSSFLPNSYYLKLIAEGRVDSIYIGEKFQKQTFRNRTELLTIRGRENITLPVAKVGFPYPVIANVVVSEHGDWRHKIWQFLKTNYQASPYWIYYSDDIYHILGNQENSLVAYNHLWLHFLCDSLELTLPSLSNQEGDFHPEVITPEYLSSLPTPRRYWQVYEHELSFQPYLSSLDLLLNLGPEARLWLLDR